MGDDYFVTSQFDRIFRFFLLKSGKTREIS